MRANVIIGVVVSVLAVLLVSLSHALYRSGPGYLTVSFLNVGQGDAIFVESPTGRQLLVDGGPDRSVLRELGSVMSWYDKNIDVVIATHPDADHISGLVDVLQRYTVQYIFDPHIGKGTTQAESLLVSVAREGAQEVRARRGQVIDLGGGVRVEILHPDRMVDTAETNDACVVVRVVYGNTAFLLTCDAPQGVEKYLVALDPRSVTADVLKAGHHGSRTSTSELFVSAVAPRHVIFSRGCENKYGHPHKEVLNLLSVLKVDTFDTCIDGRVTFVSDGTSVTRQ